MRELSRPQVNINSLARYLGDLQNINVDAPENPARRFAFEATQQ